MAEKSNGRDRSLSNGDAANGYAVGQENGNAQLNGTASGVDVNGSALHSDAAEAEKGKEGEEDEEKPSMSLAMCAGLLVVVTVVSFSDVTVVSMNWTDQSPLPSFAR